ncbi:HlyD family efflux transporter periplasmic adaptor subunit [Rivularia sp. UHCC 0363]|uniref:HlyD family efflux transporter periplasmic adaptor subunit n=1 Tax=Rivularia sp. UHCC 0363 TaxID=3110244 RepID=UPI002B20C6C4|nr:HlyD family efflux transporter periplasmic adaptor subunit [Rivularia sp. UHCC 0363]MEA5598692.1 HlyD family efflux transporter periplasmic adaptor subunit [Rivularia sp. UHCC 0363]
MKYSLAANPSQARRTKQEFAKPDEQLSYELGKAVQELPPLYTRLLAGTISAIIFGSITWAYFSKVEEVASASGKIIASTEVRPITSLGNGSIVGVNVKEGDQVERGEVLIQRDPDLQQADVARLAKNAGLIREDLRRLDAERTGVKTAGNKLQDELLLSRLQDYQARQAAAEAEANRQAALVEQAKVRLTRLKENFVNAKTSFNNAKTNLKNAQELREQVGSGVALAKTRENSLRGLTKEGAVPRLDYLDAKDRLNRANAEITRAGDQIVNADNNVTEAQDKVTSLEKDIAAQQQEISQARSAFEAAQSQAQRLASERQSEILTQINKRKEELANIVGQLEQAKKQQQLETIKSPVSGIVYDVKASKGPVQAGEPLLSILPQGEELLLEVKVLNRDIGFVRQGMKAKVKMATFPFQEFGTIPGEVVRISPNAIVDEKLGLIFPTTIKLSKKSVVLRDKEVIFTPGMVANAEIVTRKKSVLTFIVEPVTRRFSEAFSVR